MKKALDIIWGFAALLALGAVLAVKAFSSGNLTPLGVSFVTGWVAAECLVITLLHWQLSRWVAPTLIVAIFAGLIYQDYLAKTLGALTWLAAQVQPVSLLAGAGFILVAFGGIALFLRALQPKRRNPEGSEG